MLGKELAKCTQVSVLNSNYLKKKLEPYYPIVYTGKHGLCAHEFMIDIDKIHKKTGISEEDIAKRVRKYILIFYSLMIILSMLQLCHSLPMEL